MLNLIYFCGVMYHVTKIYFKIGFHGGVCIFGFLWASPVFVTNLQSLIQLMSFARYWFSDRENLKYTPKCTPNNRN